MSSEDTRTSGEKPAEPVPETRGWPGSRRLEAGDIELTALRPEDSATLFRWINDPVEVLHNAAFRPISRAEHDGWFRSVQERPDVVIFAIRRTDTKRLIGTCQLRDIDADHRSAELVIRIGEPDERGQGRGTRAVMLLTGYGFRELDLHRIQLSVFEDNRRARRVYENVGFSHEGIRREAAWVDGRFKSVVMMAMLRREYDRRDPPT